MKFKPFPELTNILLPKQCETYGEISAKPPTLNFAKRAWFEIRVQQDDAIRWNDGMAEWRNGGMAKYSTTQNALLYETKSHNNGMAMK